jgi:tetraacyldisaccharide 4'-kinase
MIRSAVERAWWQPRSTPLAQVLRPLSWIYRLAWRLRAQAFRSGLRATARAPVPVVVVGNLVVGGAGKTPTVIALVEALRQRGWTPGVISRGYGGRGDRARAVEPHDDAGSCGDEPLLIRRRTGAPVWVGRRRIDAARALCGANPAVDLIVADDGLQHTALERDAQVIVFDERGVGNGLLLPAGPLREPLGDVPPARSVVVYNAARCSAPWPGTLADRRLAGLVPLREWWAGAPARPAALDAVKGTRVLAAAGIAAPERFFAMLEAAGLTIDRLPLPDHAVLDPRPWPASDQPVIVTEKDAVKLAPDAADASRILVATLDFRIPADTLAVLDGWLDPLRRR